MKYKKWIWCLLTLTVLFSVSSIACNESGGLIGGWQEINGNEAVYFLKDNTVEIRNSNYVGERVSGTYSIVDTGKVRVQVGSGIFANTAVYNFAINQNDLTMQELGGKTTIYRRIGN